MVRRSVGALVAGLVLAVPLLPGCGADSAPTVSSEQAFVAGDGSIVEVAPADRQPAPALRATTLQGDPFDLAEATAAGDVVVLNVWASWCAPCRAEAPGLAEVAAETRGDGVQFVGLVTRDSPATAQAFVDRFKLDYPHVLDDDGSLQLLFRENLPPAAIPSTLVIDAQGRVAARVLGEVSPATLRTLLDNVAEQPGKDPA